MFTQSLFFMLLLWNYINPQQLIPLSKVRIGEHFPKVSPNTSFSSFSLDLEKPKYREMIGDDLMLVVFTHGNFSSHQEVDYIFNLEQTNLCSRFDCVKWLDNYIISCSWATSLVSPLAYGLEGYVHPWELVTWTNGSILG